MAEQTPAPTANDARQAVRTLLQFAGVDPAQPVIADTPRRFVKAWQEMTAGYAMDPRQHLERVFVDESVHGLVTVEAIQFASLCEHHLLPVYGTATVGYLPAEGRLLGLSKLPRLVEVFARRLQLQERLGRQIAETIHQDLPALGAGVVIRATHSCMTVRGVNQHQAITTTVSLAGALEYGAHRAEFLAVARDG
ncbi:GTP cyclohydrolase I FolE [Spongiactinospora gelatinilytica]|uniref:GTP cyclohydrolase 1 n=1 Tax=Spongiactinospora gelatinilytica TaxID=2666298 RepID=A0A2W2GPK3_9ACTN|nr:GTP cyclohydrolase I [Spongiactinospora gelatinilytica]PZG42015.1 GTP cyclohydrolase I FolE [Spongiactinospora gelatinilytica]